VFSRPITLYVTTTVASKRGTVLIHVDLDEGAHHPRLGDDDRRHEPWPSQW